VARQGRLKDKVLRTLEPSSPDARVCLVCRQEKPETAFTLYRNKYRSHTCKSCQIKKWPLMPCSVCGTLRHVQFINGKPKSITCVKCADRSKQASAMQKANIGRPRPDTAIRQRATRLYSLTPPTDPKLGDLSWFGAHKCVWAACAKCGKERWVQVGKQRQPKFALCVACTSQLPEHRERKRLQELGKKHSPERVEKNRQVHIGQVVTDETKDKIRQYWKDSEWRHYTIRQQRRHTCPNNPEKRLLQLLEELYPHEWKFVGDGSLVIGGLNPDFANVNGKKLIIELFGDYWHRGQNPQDRIDTFTPFGFDTLVIWESELDNTIVVTKQIREFVGK